MATVPVYDAPQVQARALGAPRQDSVASADDFGGIEAKQDAASGKALTVAGAGLSAIAYKMQERDNADAIFRAETALKEEYIQYEGLVRESRQGALAKGVTKETEDWWNSRLAKHGEALGNDEQRRIFAQRATSLRLNSAQTISNYEFTQNERAEAESLKANTNSGISLAAATPTEGNVTRALAQIETDYADYGRRKGWKPEVTKQAILEQKTTLHTAVFNGLVRTDYAAAKSYLTAAEQRGEIDGRQLDNLKKTLEEGGKDTLAQNFGDAALAAGLTLDQATEKARKELSGPEEEHVVGRLEQRYRRKDAAALGAVHLKILGGISKLDLQTDPEFMRLDDGAKATAIKTWQGVQEHKTNLAAAQESRAAARESREYTREARAAAQLTTSTWAAFYQYNTVEALSSMSELQVANLLPVLGPQHTTTLLNHKKALDANPAKFSEGKIDQDLFNRVAEDFNLAPFKDKKSPEDKARLGQVKDAVEREIGVVQKQRKAPIDPTEKEKLMRAILAREVSKGGVAGYFTSSTPAAAVIPADYGSVNVPKADRAKIEAALKSRGKPVNDKAIVELYLRGQRTP